MSSPLTNIDFKSATVEQILTYFQSNQNIGLSTADVTKSITIYGFNEVPEPHSSQLRLFLKMFWGLSAWLLEVIIILSLILGNLADVWIVTGLLILNAVIGFTEQRKAAAAVSSLKQRLHINAKVLREGFWKQIAARELVPGDIVHLRSGDFVPADVKIIVGELMVDQSSLTGESRLLKMEVNNLLYEGSIVKRGEITGIVTQTGAKTYFGRTSQLVQLAHPKLHMEEIVSKVVRWLLAIVIVLLIIMSVLSVLQGTPLINILPLILVLLLSAIPVALPAMFTVTMALGSSELAKKGVLITRLSASEDAATMTVLCSDKTGTITQNKLTITKILPWEQIEEKEVIIAGALASQEANQDAIDQAFLSYAHELHVDLNSYASREFIPFDTSRRRTEATINYKNNDFKVTKGAIATITKLCKLNQPDIDKLNISVNELAQKGYRTLAVAKMDQSDNWRFLGVVALYDVPRSDSKQAIEALKALGITTKMVTGDAQPIAVETAKSVGLGEHILNMNDIHDMEVKEPQQVNNLIETSDGFAEIYPQDKFKIIHQLQKSGHVVGMTGDGVNDAPALRQAEVGIAVASATDVAKESASVVLISEGLTGIVDLVKNGRMIYQRIITWILSKISRTVFNNAFIVIAFLLTGKYIISAFEVILLLFLTDFVKISLATDHVNGSKQPDTWNITGLLAVAMILGGLMFIEFSGLLWVGFAFWALDTNTGLLESFTFAVFLYSSLLSLFSLRERQFFWKSKPGGLLFWAIIIDIVIASLVLVIGLPEVTPIPFSFILVIFFFSFVCILGINDLIKVKLYHFKLFSN